MICLMRPVCDMLKTSETLVKICPASILPVTRHFSQLVKCDFWTTVSETTREDFMHFHVLEFNLQITRVLSFSRVPKERNKKFAYFSVANVYPIGLHNNVDIE